MSTSVWFDEIGLAYAKHHDEIEAARSEFSRQRQVLIDRLNHVLEDRLAKTLANAAQDRGKSEGGWETLWLTGTYAKARQQAGTTERQSGISFGLDTDPCFVAARGGCFGFGAYVFFKMSAKRYAQLRSTMVGLEAVAEYIDDGNAYLRSAWITPGTEQFRFDAFEQAVDRLPALFAKADEMIGHEYRKQKFG